MARKTMNTRTTEVYKETPDEAMLHQRPQSRFVGHLRRFWWLYLLIIAIPLLVVLPVMFVWYPKVIRAAVDAGTIQATTVDLDYFGGDISMFINAVWTTPDTRNPVVEQWQAELAYSVGTRFLEKQTIEEMIVGGPDVKVLMPRMPAVNGTTFSIPIKIKKDSVVYNSFAKDFTASSRFSVILRGKAAVTKPGLPTVNVDYYKEIDLSGLNSWAGLRSITARGRFSGQQGSSPQLSGTAAEVVYDNPTNVTIDLGTMAFDMEITDTDNTAVVLIPDFEVRPGKHTYPAQLQMSQATVDYLQNDTPNRTCANFVVYARPVKEQAYKETTVLGNLTHVGGEMRQTQAVLNVAPAYNLSDATPKLKLDCFNSTFGLPN